MKATFWRGLAAMESAAGLEADWRWQMGGVFPAVAPFLRRTHEVERAHPCLADPPCGCRHAVRETRAGLIGACVCGGGECEAFPVEPGQLGVLQLDRVRFADALRGALGLEDCGTAPFTGRFLHEIGALSQAAAPVCVGFGNANLLLAELEAFWARRTGPMLLLVPVPLRPATALHAVLSRQGTLQLALSDWLEPELGGRFQPSGQIARLLDPWLAQIGRNASQDTLFRAIHREISAVRREFSQLAKATEPVDEDVARQLFALVKQLESDAGVRKAPLVQVFRLYCLESLPAAQVARRCRCSKALIISRLAQLRRKLGRDPAQLRAISGQFERIEDSLSDSRARRIYRSPAAGGDGDAD